MYNTSRSKSRHTCGNKFINILLRGKVYFSLIHQHDSTDSHHGRINAFCSCRYLPVSLSRKGARDLSQQLPSLPLQPGVKEGVLISTPISQTGGKGREAGVLQ